MIKGINYWAFANNPDVTLRDPVQAMRRARQIGFDSIELTVEPEGLVSQSMTQKEADKLRNEAGSLGIELKTLASGLAWGTSPTHPDGEVRERAIENAIRMIEIASWLGIDTLLYLPGMVSAVFVPDFKPQPYDHVDRWAREAVRRLMPHAEKTGVRIAVENVW
ncbi:MAG TPA: sugar phosphate isomerase/epimerase family protein, partial [Spirochaetia bacterium]|nr:sugar phosphate isomerase/epimerase family protein [Spirochaetia bacterium]